MNAQMLVAGRGKICVINCSYLSSWSLTTKPTINITMCYIIRIGTLEVACVLVLMRILQHLSGFCHCSLNFRESVGYTVVLCNCLHLNTNLIL